MSKKRPVLGLLLAASVGAYGISLPVFGAVSAEEAKQLGTTLTEFGAIKAGNADGSIPAYTGGLGPNVPGYDPKTSRTYVDPYKNEKPLYSINANNMAQYDAVLTGGTKALLKRFAGYRVDVYPTHRSMRYPEWVLQNTIKNATTANLGGPVEGDNLLGANANGEPYPGIPFPIPKTGYEVMWNTVAKYAPPITQYAGERGVLVDAAGNMTQLPNVDGWYIHHWYDKSGKLSKESPVKNDIFALSAFLTSPPTSAGIVFLNHYTTRGEDGGQKVWFYTPGQRRVRLAPEFAYDVPIASYGGVMLWDEIYGYVGRMDRFDFKLVGKKEMIVPYNVFGASGNTMLVKDIVGPKFINPDSLRWEKHRVWVVEATRKANARHVYSKRIFYVDEDSFVIVTNEGYDDAGNLYRVHQNDSFPSYTTGGMNYYGWQTYDLIKGNYFIIDTGMMEPGGFIHHYDSVEGHSPKLSPQSVADGSVR